MALWGGSESHKWEHGLLKSTAVSWPGNSVSSWCEIRGRVGENMYVMPQTWRGNVSWAEGLGVWGVGFVWSAGVGRGLYGRFMRVLRTSEGKSGLCCWLLCVVSNALACRRGEMWWKVWCCKSSSEVISNPWLEETYLWVAIWMVRMENMHTGSVSFTFTSVCSFKAVAWGHGEIRNSDPNNTHSFLSIWTVENMFWSTGVSRGYNSTSERLAVFSFSGGFGH